MRSNLKHTTEIFIQNAKLIHGDKYSYEKVNYVRNNVNVIITCKEHGDFEQRPANHIFNKENCPKCSFGRPETTESYIVRAKNFHGDKFIYEKTVFTGWRNKLIVICRIHGDMEIFPGHHLKHDCRKCDALKQSKARRDSKEFFIKKAIKVHGNKYDYSPVIMGKANEKIEIICKIHGSFKQKSAKHLEGSGCRKCGIEFIKQNQTTTLNKFIEKSNLKHNYKYDYSKVRIENGKNKVEIICKKHGSFFQKIKNHFQGQGCPKCAKEVIILKKKKTTESFCEEAKKIHGNVFDYSKVEYNGCYEPVEIICNKHGSFFQAAHVHLRGNGCSKCSGPISKVETEWLNSLQIPEEYRNKTIKINNKTIIPDAFDPVTNTIYEFYGSFYHGDPRQFEPEKKNNLLNKTFKELYTKTINREKLIKNAGYNLVTMWEKDWYNLKKEFKNV